ncbi:hypothetical protein EV361DRAFT_955480 [Lentinula raphanica]|nr:hypothetical protein EV361DRAFT_955480 [Lentinula raphanica]
MDAQRAIESSPSTSQSLDSHPSTNQSLGNRPNVEKTQALDMFFDIKAQVDSDEEDFESDEDEEDGFIDDQESDTSSVFPSDNNQPPSSPATGFLDLLEQRYTHRDAANALR